MGNTASYISGTRKNFGVGGDLDARSIGPNFLSEKSSATAPGGGEDNAKSFLPADRRARHC